MLRLGCPRCMAIWSHVICGIDIEQEKTLEEGGRYFLVIWRLYMRVLLLILYFRVKRTGRSRNVRPQLAWAAVRIRSPNGAGVSQTVWGADDGGLHAGTPSHRRAREGRIVHYAASDVGPKRQRSSTLVPPVVTASHPDRSPRPRRQACADGLRREEWRGLQAGASVREGAWGGLWSPKDLWFHFSL